jgi:hypothetical protein
MLLDGLGTFNGDVVFRGKPSANKSDALHALILGTKLSKIGNFAA